MMQKVILYSVVLCLATCELALGQAPVRISELSGEVKIRRGVEESWQPTSRGTTLEIVDSILTGEAGEVVLQLQDGTTFRLGGNAILDVADLRKITEQELFLGLMSRKIQNIEPRQKKSQLRIGKVNVVHGEQRQALDEESAETPNFMWELEKNGALALYGQNYTTNCILKLNNILGRYTDLEDCGEVQYYQARAFERLNRPGQALDAYKAVLQKQALAGCEEEAPAWFTKAQDAIHRLGQN